LVVTVGGKPIMCRAAAEPQSQFSCTAAATADIGDGKRFVVARVTDAAGNSDEIALGPSPGWLEFDVDEPHPTATLERIPKFTGPTRPESTTVWFTPKDPFAKGLVSAHLSVFTNKPTAAPSVELVRTDDESGETCVGEAALTLGSSEQVSARQFMFDV